MNRPIINGVVELMQHIAEYAVMFPNTYTTFEWIEDALQHMCDSGHGLGGGPFGFEVSPEWEDKCYGFEVERIEGEQVYFKYLGIWKC